MLRLEDILPFFPDFTEIVKFKVHFMHTQTRARTHTHTHTDTRTHAYTHTHTHTFL